MKTVFRIHGILKQTNIQVLGISEVMEKKKNIIENLFSEIIAENFPNLKKVHIKIQETYGTSKRHVQKRTSTQYIIVKLRKVQHKREV